MARTEKCRSIHIIISIRALYNVLFLSLLISPSSSDDGHPDDYYTGYDDDDDVDDDNHYWGFGFVGLMLLMVFSYVCYHCYCRNKAKGCTQQGPDGSNRDTETRQLDDVSNSMINTENRDGIESGGDRVTSTIELEPTAPPCGEFDALPSYDSLFPAS